MISLLHPLCALPELSPCLIDAVKCNGIVKDSSLLGILAVMNSMRKCLNDALGASSGRGARRIRVAGKSKQETSHSSAGDI